MIALIAIFIATAMCLPPSQFTVSAPLGTLPNYCGGRAPENYVEIFRWEQNILRQENSVTLSAQPRANAYAWLNMQRRGVLSMLGSRGEACCAMPPSIQSISAGKVQYSMMCDAGTPGNNAAQCQSRVQRIREERLCDQVEADYRRGKSSREELAECAVECTASGQLIKIPFP